MATKFNFSLIAKISTISVTSLAACHFHSCNSQPPNKMTLGLENAGTLDALDGCSLRLDGDVAESCSLLGSSLLSTFNSHSKVTLHHNTSLCFQTLGPSISLFTSIVTMKECPLTVLSSFLEKIQEEKNNHASLNFQRFSDCNLFILCQML